MDTHRTALILTRHLVLVQFGELVTIWGYTIWGHGEGAIQRLAQGTFTHVCVKNVYDDHLGILKFLPQGIKT